MSSTSSSPPAKRVKLSHDSQSNTGSLGRLNTPALHNILHFIQSQSDKFRVLHSCRKFYLCAYPWAEFYIPYAAVEGKPFVLQHTDVLEQDTYEPFGPALTDSEHVYQAKKFLSLGHHWNFHECHTLLLQKHNAFTVRIMQAFRLVAPNLTTVTYIHTPLDYLSAQEIRRLKKRMQAMNLTIHQQDKVLPMCKCQRMLSIQNSGYCFACAPSLTEAVNLSQRFLIDGGMKSIALQNYYYTG